MATETEVTEQQSQETATETQQSEAQETVSQNQTLEDMVREEQAKRAESESEGETGKKPHKLSAQERIRQLNEQKKTAEQRAREAEEKAAAMQSAMQSEFEALKAEIARINQLVASGQISKSEGKRATREAQIDFTKAIEAIEVPEELEPFKADIAKIAMTIADSAIRPFREKFQQIEAEREELERQRYQTELENFQREVLGNYSSVAAEFPDLFLPSEDGKLPELKPEYEEEALEIASLFNIPIKDMNGNDAYYNTLLSTKVGLSMLMHYLSRRTDTVRKAKESIEKTKELVGQAKKNRVESPESMRGTPVRKQSLLEIVEDTIKQFQ